MRDGAREALRQLGERLESLSTDKHRRDAGMIHKMWQWINDRVSLEQDETAPRRRHFRLAIMIPGSRTFMPRIPSLGCRCQSRIWGSGFIMPAPLGF